MLRKEFHIKKSNCLLPDRVCKNGKNFQMEIAANAPKMLKAISNEKDAGFVDGTIH
jgi:hypothetical protein